LERESHVLWTNLEVCTCQAQEKQIRLGQFNSFLNFYLKIAVEFQVLNKQHYFCINLPNRVKLRLSFKIKNKKPHVNSDNNSASIDISSNNLYETE
jgi:hypothetical protein